MHLKPSLPLLHRVIAQPWAVHRDTLRLFSRMLLSGDELPKPAGKTRDGKTPQIIRPDAADYAPLSDESWIAVDQDWVPDLPELRQGLSVIMPWGVMGRAWGCMERMWLGAVDVDEMIEEIAESPEGSTVVLWFRSPGGIITGIPEAAGQLRQLGKTRRLIAFTDDMCCSAAYWLAAQCSEIHATPTADLGSIGVYIALYDFTEYLSKMGVSLELFKAGTMKAMGIEGNPLSPEESALLQAQVDESYRAFTGDVTRNRAIATETMQGQSLRGKEALGANLADNFWPSASAFFTALGKGKI
jgi:signal peptide peptidase SppA